MKTKTNPLLPVLGLGLTLLLTACPVTPTPGDGVPTSGFTISVEPTELTMEQMSSARTTLTITPHGGFTGTVNLSLLNAANGEPAFGFALAPIIVDVPGPDPVTVPFTVSAGSPVDPGTYNLQVRGTSGRIVNRADLTVTVNPSSGGGEEGGGNGTTVTVRQLDTSFAERAYYRTGDGPWKPLDFTFGWGFFTADGEYEVAVQCDPWNLHLFKANSARTPKLIFSCSGANMTKSFYVDLPTEIGGKRIWPGDYVSVSDSLQGYSGIRPMRLMGTVPWGEQEILFTVFSSPLSISPDPVDFITPLGYKLVNVAVSNNVPVDNTDWHPFSGLRAMTFNLPPGFAGSGHVAFFKEGMKVPTFTGIERSYGILPVPGKYIGFAQAHDSGFKEGLYVLKDIGGSDWNARFPNPWTSGQFAVDGDTLIFNYPQAQAYLFDAVGILEDTTSPMDPYLRVKVYIYEGGSTSYTLPVVPGLNYRLADFDTRSVWFSLTAFQGDPFPFQGLTTEWTDRLVDALYSLVDPLDLSEDILSGMDLSWALRRGEEFSGRNYVLP